MTVTKGCATMRAHTAPRQKNAKLSRHGLDAARIRAFSLSNRAKRPTSAQSRAHLAAARGAFSSLLAGKKVCTRYKKLTGQVRGAERDVLGA